MKKILLLILFFVIGFGAISQEALYRPGELLIQINKDVNSLEFIRKFESNTGYGVYHFQCLSKTASMYKVVLDDKSLPLNSVLQDFYKYEEVLNVQKNHLVSIRETIPSDTLFTEQWFHKNTGQTGGTIDADTDASEAWDITTGGLTTHNDSIVVCIIESNGVDLDHIDLKDNIWKNYAEIPNDGIDNDNNGYVDDFKGWNVSTLNDGINDGNHGTSVAGMVGATGNNTTGVSGMNWNVQMMIVEGQNASDESSVIAAYDYPLTMRKKYNESYGQEGAFVVATNASWGLNNGDPADAPLWCAMYDTLGSYGILNVAATTNSNANVDVVGDLPTTCSSEYLIGVTMTNHNDQRANSGYGTTHVDLGAPGSGVFLTDPTDTYGNNNGTSFASPCVAGAVALAYSAPCPNFISLAKYNPAAAALDMRSYILSSVDIIPGLDTEVASGGRLNIKNAIDSIIADCPTNSCIQPYNLRDVYITDTSAKFKWEGFSTDYLLYIQEGANSAVEHVLSNQDSIVFDTLTPCTNYSIWVKAICATDTSEVSYPLNFISDGCCNNPNLILDNSNEDSITVAWNDILYATAYDIRYRKEGDINWIQTFSDTTSPITFNSLDTCTNYEFQIKTICFDSTHGFSNSFIFSTLGCGACYEAQYCNVLGANDNFEWIESVTINTGPSVTGADNGWLQSEYIIANFIPGDNYPVKIKPGYSGTNFTERISIWVDLDQNGIFDAPEQLLIDQSTNDSLIATIGIPLSALNGITKMRIGMNALDQPVACPPGTSFFGEYEDYCVYIGQDANISKSEEHISIFPNPTGNNLYIQSTQKLNALKIYDISGQLLYESTQPTSIVDVSAFKQGIYIVTIATDKGESQLKFIKQ